MSEHGDLSLTGCVVAMCREKLRAAEGALQDVRDGAAEAGHEAAAAQARAKHLANELKACDAILPTA